MSNDQPKSWRDVRPVHPAAELFPRMTPDELEVLGSVQSSAQSAPGGRGERRASAMTNNNERRRRIPHHPRQPATAAERRQAAAVARFVYDRGLADEPLLFAMAIISRRFPEISLDTALVGFVFRALLISPPGPPLLDMPVRGAP